MESQHMQVRANTEFSAAIEHLESLIDSLKRGTIFIAQGGKSIYLKPSGPVALELEAAIRPNDGLCRERIALTLKWQIRESPLREVASTGTAHRSVRVPSLFAATQRNVRDGDGAPVGGEARDVRRPAGKRLRRGTPSGRQEKPKRGGPGAS
jgi:amphi-Trp domain-containing protein